MANRQQVMLIGNGAEPSDLDPQLITGIPERDIVNTLFEGLTRVDPRDLHAIPGIAKSWDVSSGGRVYTFHLRSDARWSNGDPLTAV
ncbi:MAG TPA: ABC transporter substrate-binding protein, partial [Chloroflexota bacterium]|nr:ABC transporter substrate-binding protein [Chloroflexota bacterium]